MTDVLHKMVIRTHTLRVELGKTITRGSVKNSDSWKDSNFKLKKNTMETKDWNGNKKSVFTSLGASSHAVEEREKHDNYATEPKATELLLKLEKFSNNIWECACGGGHLSEVLLKNGYNVKSTDLIDRDYASELVDFLGIDNIDMFDGDIITNPPYKYAEQFVEKALSLIPKGNRVAMFMGIQFLEGKKRREFLRRFPIKIVYVSSSRLYCAKNGDFEKYKSNSARCYAWFIWEKGHTGDTTLKLFN
jgi:hypothetical protein